MKDNARLSSLELSKLIKILPRTIIYRIKQLEKNQIIQGYRANINLEKFGYEYYKINFKLNSIKDIEKLKSLCEFNQNIIFIDYTISDYDFEIDLEIENKDKLNQFIKDLKNLVKIRHHEIITFKTYHKLESTPSLK